MASIILRFSGPTDKVSETLKASGYRFEREWQPGTLRGKRLQTDYGFNLCLNDDPESSTAESIKGALEMLQRIAGDLGTQGLSLDGSEMDIGLFPEAEQFNATASLSCEQMETLTKIGVNVMVSCYLPTWKRSSTDSRPTPD